jgi:hypothetical protein
MIQVTSPSGGSVEVMTTDEEQWYIDRAQRYLTDNTFQYVSDLQDLDRLLSMELTAWRLGLWLMKDVDYLGEEIDRHRTQVLITETSKEIRQLKKSMGIDRATREKEKGESVADRWAALERAAEDMGLHRENQLQKALSLFNELSALIGTHARMDDVERKEREMTKEDIWKWIEEVAIPEYQALDAYFREHVQKMWVGTL